MSVVRCEMGHFYDNNRHTSCPHCKVGIEDEKTVSGVASYLTARGADAQNLVDFNPPSRDDEKTIGIYKKKGWDPVTGWIVCVNGPERGRDYRLHAGRNFLGRSLDMDISITDDMEISRENHCSIVYDPKSCEFLLVPGSASIYLNKQATNEVKALTTGDMIGAGGSEFVFIPFSVKGREW